MRYIPANCKTIVYIFSHFRTRGYSVTHSRVWRRRNGLWNLSSDISKWLEVHLVERGY